MDKVTGQCPQTTTLNDVDVKITSGYISFPFQSMVIREPLWPSSKAKFFWLVSRRTSVRI